MRVCLLGIMLHAIALGQQAVYIGPTVSLLDVPTLSSHLRAVEQSDKAAPLNVMYGFSGGYIGNVQPSWAVFAELGLAINSRDIVTPDTLVPRQRIIQYYGQVGIRLFLFRFRKYAKRSKLHNLYVQAGVGMAAWQRRLWWYTPSGIRTEETYTYTDTRAFAKLGLGWHYAIPHSRFSLSPAGFVLLAGTASFGQAVLLPDVAAAQNISSNLAQYGASFMVAYKVF